MYFWLLNEMTISSQHQQIGAIKTITDCNGRDQCHHCYAPKRSQDIPSNAMRKAVAISLEATRRACQQMQQGRRDGGLSITMILILRQQRILPQGRQLLQSVRDECKLRRFSYQRRSQGSYAWCNDGNYRHRQHGQRKQHKLCDDGGHGNNKPDNKKISRVQGKGLQTLPPTWWACQSLVQRVPR